MIVGAEKIITFLNEIAEEYDDPWQRANPVGCC
jgi:hypothetical protein